MESLLIKQGAFKEVNNGTGMVKLGWKRGYGVEEEVKDIGEHTTVQAS